MPPLTSERPRAKSLIGTAQEGALDQRNPDNETPAETAYLRTQFAQHGGAIHPTLGHFMTGPWKHKFPDQVKQDLLTKMRSSGGLTGAQGSTMAHTDAQWRDMFPGSKVGAAPSAQTTPAGVTPSAQVRHDAAAPAPATVAATTAPVAPTAPAAPAPTAEQVGKGRVTTYASNQGVNRVLESPYGSGFSTTPARVPSPTDPRALAGGAPPVPTPSTAATPPLPITAGVPAATPGLMGAGVKPSMQVADTRLPSAAPQNDPRSLAGAPADDGDGPDKETAADTKSETPSVLDRAPDEEKRKNRDLIAQMRAAYQ